MVKIGMVRRGAIGALVLCAAAALPAAGQTQWKAGVAKVAITPKEPMWMAGYGGRTKPSEGVLHELYAKALALEDAAGTRSVIVTADILGFSRDMAATVAGRVEKKYGVPRARLVLSASHTHSGPVTGEVLRPAYPVDDKQIAIIQGYTAGLLDQLVDLVGASIANLQPAQLSFEQGLAGFGVNRRRVGARNRPGPVDHDVPVLSVRSGYGNLRAVVFGYACHNTNLSGYQYTGDYAGVAQAELEKTYPGAAALYIAGCGADVNPLPRRTAELMTMYGQILAASVDLVLKAKMKPVSGPLKAVWEYVDLPFQKAPSREQLQAQAAQGPEAGRRYAQYLLEKLERDGRLPDRYPYPIQVWQFGRDLTLIPMAGEVVVDYALRFKGQYGWDNTWVAAYANDVFAYIPSLRVLNEGGYEGGGAMVPYGQPAPFRAPVEEIIAEKVDQLVKRMRAE
jgi:neutral ceramidase